MRGVRGFSPQVLGAGAFSKVARLERGHVVKIGRSYLGLAQPLSWIVRNRREHEVASRYFRVPTSYHLRVLDDRGVPVNLILQRHLDGIPMAELGETELLGLSRELKELDSACRTCWRIEGWLPDVIGGPPRYRMHDIRNSNNLFLDRTTRTLHLLDPSALFCWFARSSVLGRVYAPMLLTSARLLAARASRSARRA